MRKLALAALTAAALVVPASSRAGVFVGLRAGYAFPGGDVHGVTSSNVPLQLQSNIPLQLDLGYAGILHYLAVGGYAAIGFTQVGNQLKSYCASQGGTCDARLWEAGVQANVHPFLGLWAGVFGGWQQQTVSGTFAGVSASESLRGWESGVQGGWDFGAAGVGFGPYVSWASGKFQTSASTGSAAMGGATPLGNLGVGTANHSWLTLGIRGVFGL